MTISPQLAIIGGLLTLAAIAALLFFVLTYRS